MFNSDYGGFGASGVDASLTARVTALEDALLKVTYFALVSSTTGTITPPTGGTILLDQFASSVDALTSKIDGNNNPTDITPQTAGGTYVTTTLDANGNYVLSGTPADATIAIIYVYSVARVNFDYTKSIGFEETNLFTNTDRTSLSAIQGVTTQRLIGRYSSGSGNVEQITIGSGLSLSGGGVLSATGVSSQWTTTGNDIYYATGNVMIGFAGAPGTVKLQTVENGTTTFRGVSFEQYNNGTESSKVFSRKARGSFGSPSAINTGDLLSNWTSSGYDGSGFVDSASIRITSVGTIGASRVPTKMEFMTMTDAAPGVLTVALTLDQTQAATFANTVTSTAHILSGTDGAGYIGYISQSSNPSAPSSGYRLFADSTGRLSWRRASDGFIRTFDATLTANRVYTLPDVTDTIAVLGLAQTFSAKQTFTASSTEIASLTVLDTTYKTALDVSAANTLRIGNGFTTLTTPITTINLTGGSTSIGSTTGGLILATSSGGNTVVIRTVGDANANSGTNITMNGNATNGSTNRAICTINGTYAPTSGTTANFRGINLAPTINETSTAANTMAMIDINPTLTSVKGTIYGLRSQLASSPTGGGTAWNIYADGTANSYFNHNILIGGTTSAASATMTLHVYSGTAPSGNITDGFTMYSADIAAGNAAPNFRTENGAIIKLFEETGWTQMTGTATKGGFDTGTVTTAQLAQVVKALTDLLGFSSNNIGFIGA